MNNVPEIDRELRDAFDQASRNSGKEIVDIDNIDIVDVHGKAAFVGKRVRAFNLRKTLAYKKKVKSRSKMKIVKKSRKVNRKK